MPVGLKELIVVLTLSAATFHLAKPVALKFCSAGDFARRRAIWFVLTVAAFLSPNFWVFMLVAAPTLIWGGRKDTNQVAFYLMLMQVVPPVSIDIPVVGINNLFQLDIYRLLSFCVLVPAAWRLWRFKDPAVRQVTRFGVLDMLLIAFLVLQTLLYVPPDLPGHVLLSDSFTNVLRRGFLQFIDVYVLYYVVNRSCSSRASIVEAMATFCLACALIAPVAVFENLRGWLLYTDMATRWTGDTTLSFYLVRGDVVRAEVTSGHALALGYALAIAFGFWLYLGSHVAQTRTRFAVGLLFCLGLVAAYSRGPWMGGVVIYLTFAALGPRAVSRVLKAGAVMAVVGGALLLSPVGERIVSVLPFMGGSVDNDTLLYRQRLATRSWELIKESPFFGDQLAVLKMEDLRQGQGLIDFVNTYASMALFYGLVGLTLFLLFIVIALLRAYRLSRAVTKADPDLALLGVSLLACIVGTLVMIAGCSLIFAYAKLFYVLGALAAAYSRLAPAAQPQATTERRLEYAAG